MLKITENNFILIIQSIFICFFTINHCIGQEDVANVDDGSSESNGIEMTVHTDKTSYYLNEPITLEIILTNRSKEGRNITIPVGYGGFDIVILTPIVKNIPKCPPGLDKEMFLDLFKQKPIELTEFGNSIEHPDNKEIINLRSGEKYISRIPIGLMFDLSNYRMGGTTYGNR